MRNKNFFLTTLPLTLSFVFMLIAIILLTQKKTVYTEASDEIELIIDQYAGSDDKRKQPTLKKMNDHSDSDTPSNIPLSYDNISPLRGSFKDNKKTSYEKITVSNNFDEKKKIEKSASKLIILPKSKKQLQKKNQLEEKISKYVDQQESFIEESLEKKSNKDELLYGLKPLADALDNQSLKQSAPPDVFEESPYGKLPKIAANGLTPLVAFANAKRQKAKQLPYTDNKIAIVIAGMGLSKKTTKLAIENLPEQVGFAFAPYSYQAQQQAGNARKNGHEILLQVPLEPYGYPDNDPGPHTLLQNLSDKNNIMRLHWIMSRFDSYIGITNYMGAKFAGNHDSMRLLMRETAQRGLLYLDNGSSSKNKVEKAAVKEGTRYSFADIIIDAQLDKANIRDALEDLENIARQKGQAIGFASAFPLSIEEVERWTDKLKTRGFKLVPLSALYSDYNSKKI